MRIQDNIASEFDEFSKNYTGDMQKCVPHYDFLLSLFAEGFSVNFKAENILDLGCGNGNVTKQLLIPYPKATYTLLDASKEMLGICRERFKDTKIAVVESYFNDFEFPNNHFDIVAAGFSLHHCTSSEKQLLFQKVYTCLKEGGVFTTSDLMIDKNDTAHPRLIEQWKTLVNSNFPNGEKWTWIMEHYDEFDKPDSLNNQLNWLRDAGFKDIDIIIKDGYWAHFKAKKSY